MRVHVYQILTQNIIRLVQSELVTRYQNIDWQEVFNSARNGVYMIYLVIAS